MSASSKKKLRKEQEAARMTERQQKEKKEARKTKAYTIVFICVMVVVVLTFAIVATFNYLKSSGYLSRNTTAAVTGDHKLNSVEMSYFFNDAIENQYNSWYEMYGNYMSFYTSMWNLDLYAPLNEQKNSDGQLWSDFFVEQALNAAKETYALYDLAVAEGLTLTEEQEANVQGILDRMTSQAKAGGFKNLDEYLVAYYGYGSSKASFEKYQRVNALAAAYYTAHQESLEYTAEDVKAHNEKNPAAYNSYSFNAYYVTVADYLPEATKDADGNTIPYTDEQKEAARAAAEKEANALAAAKTVLELDQLIAALEVNKDAENIASDPYVDSLYSTLPESFQTWMSVEGRKIGDTGVIADRVLSADHEHEEGEEHSEDEGEINGYYVVIFNGVKFNNEPLANVRHLLVSYQGGTYDSETGTTTYSDESKAAAKEEAEKYLNEWRQGEATEATFIELVQKYSDDSSASEGGLFEDITPVSPYVENFLNWSIDPDRKAGDVEIIETEYGCHIMYYVADDEMTYREYMIRDDLLNTDMEEWYTGIMETVTITKKKVSRLPLDRAIINY